MSERPPHTEAEIVELVRSIDVQASPELHRRIDALVGERGARHARESAHRRPPAAIRWGLAGALALAAVAAVLVVSLSGNGSPTLTLHSTVALTLRSPTMAAPAQNPHNATELAADVEGVAFPYWEDRFGWRSTGARVDHLGGRTVTTVFYARGHDQWLGYAIVAGASAPHVSGGIVREREGTPYRFLSVDNASVVTWLRDGHLCVMAGHGMSDAQLMSLASWRERGTLNA
jgi:hypothetical protein